jgi:hypothetical protein
VSHSVFLSNEQEAEIYKKLSGGQDIMVYVKREKKEKKDFFWEKCNLLFFSTYLVLHCGVEQLVAC